MPNYAVTIKEINPLLHHRYTGVATTTLSDEDAAENSCYRMVDDDEESNIAIPGTWLRGCVIQSFVDTAKKKTAAEVYFSPNVQVMEYRIDTGIKKYVIHKAVIPVKKNGKIAAQGFVCRPLINKYKISFTLQTTLEDESDKDVERAVRNAGKSVGIGAGRKLGFGRFEVVSFKKIND